MAQFTITVPWQPTSPMALCCLIWADMLAMWCCLLGKVVANVQALLDSACEPAAHQPGMYTTFCDKPSAHFSCMFCAVINIHEAKLLEPVTSRQWNAWLLYHAKWDIACAIVVIHHDPFSFILFYFWCADIYRDHLFYITFISCQMCQWLY